MTTTQSEITEERLREALTMEGDTYLRSDMFTGTEMRQVLTLALEALTRRSSAGVEFGGGRDWDAAAHIRLLRSGDGPSAGYTADLIEKLYEAVVASEATTCKPILQVAAWLGTNLAGEKEPFLDKRKAEFWSSGAFQVEPLYLPLSPQEPVTGEAVALADEWHLGSQNDGLFIINKPPRPSNDDQVHEYRDGISPNVVLSLGNWMDRAKAQAICDAHNEVIRQAIVDRDEARDLARKWRAEASVGAALHPTPSPLPAAEGEWDIETTAEIIARKHSQYKGGRLHAGWYGPAKAAALEALVCARNKRNEELTALASPSTGVNDAMVERAKAEFLRWDEGFTTKPRNYIVYRRGDDGEFEVMSEHEDRAAMEAALFDARFRASLAAHREK